MAIWKRKRLFWKYVCQEGRKAATILLESIRILAEKGLDLTLDEIITIKTSLENDQIGELSEIYC